MADMAPVEVILTTGPAITTEAVITELDNLITDLMFMATGKKDTKAIITKEVLMVILTNHLLAVFLQVLAVTVTGRWPSPQ